MNERIFNHYLNDLLKLQDKHRQIRYITIEYLCSFPKIDAITMARELIGRGAKIVFDDSSITRAENEIKKRRVGA